VVCVLQRLYVLRLMARGSCAAHRTSAGRGPKSSDATSRACTLIPTYRERAARDGGLTGERLRGNLRPAVAAVNTPRLGVPATSAVYHERRPGKLARTSLGMEPLQRVEQPSHARDEAWVALRHREAVRIELKRACATHRLSLDVSYSHVRAIALRTCPIADARRHAWPKLAPPRVIGFFTHLLDGSQVRLRVQLLHSWVAEREREQP
jgi:hypothetical protein